MRVGWNVINVVKKHDEWTCFCRFVTTFVVASPVVANSQKVDALIASSSCGAVAAAWGFPQAGRGSFAALPKSNTLMTDSQNNHAGSSSIFNPAWREIISASVLL